MTESTAATKERTRRIVHHSFGKRQGAITRLMSPSDLGRRLKPFVFLDLFDIDQSSFPNVGWHPHSGIATLTYLWEGSVRYEDTTGAHHYIDSLSSEPGQALQNLGGAMLVIATASGGKAVAQIVKGLRPRGKVMTLGATPDPIEVSTSDLLFASRSIEGAITGDPATGDATLKFSVLTGVAAMIETMPLERAAEAYAKMMAGKVRFRMVLTM